MADTSEIAQVFTDERTFAEKATQAAQDAITQTFAALANSSIYDYTPYEWQVPSPPLIGPLPDIIGPNRPGLPATPKVPTLVDFKVNVPNPSFGTAPISNLTPPTINLPSLGPQLPSDNTGSPPGVAAPSFPASPNLLPLPSSDLPYPFITIPTAPIITPPVFSGKAPDDIASMTLQEFLDKLTSTYSLYSQQIPPMIQNNTMVWFNAFLSANPNVRILDGIITTYTVNGGTGVPVPLEEAIITRAVDRVDAEYKRSQRAVLEDMSKRGLTLPSGAMLAGLKEARATRAEAVSKVAVDVAIKNLDLEHDHMKFMLQLGTELQKVLLGFATDTGKIMLECNAQAIELTKLVLTGMIESYNQQIKIYLAKWEGYKAAVEVFRALIQAQEEQVRLYEAQIRAELAKTEINKAVVAVLEAVANANRSIADVYKTQVEAEAAKVEVSRVQIMAYEALVHAYVAKVEGYKAAWEGYKAQVEGQLAVATVYKTQVEGYMAAVNAYKANVEAYGEQVRGYTAQIQAISAQNEANLKAYSIELDGIMKAYGYEVQAYAENWRAIGEQMRAGANITSIQAEFLSKMYTSQVQIDVERAREHLSQWRTQLEGALQAASGMSHAAGVASQLAGSVLSGLTAFAGTLATTTAS